jgi:sugar lactone lactonase YvrE
MRKKTVTTLPGEFSEPIGLAIDTLPDGRRVLYICDAGVHCIYMLDLDTGKRRIVCGTYTEEGHEDGAGTACRLFYPTGVCVAPNHDLFIADCYNNAVRQYVRATDEVITYAGNTKLGHKDGDWRKANFYGPYSVAVDSNGNVFVSDLYNQCIRQILYPSREVTTLAGNHVGKMVDGKALQASFAQPGAICLDALDNLYIADTSNHAVRCISKSGRVTTFAGNGLPGHTDSSGIEASFSNPWGLCCDNAGNLIVADTNNHSVRFIFGQHQDSLELLMQGARDPKSSDVPIHRSFGASPMFDKSVINDIIGFL